MTTVSWQYARRRRHSTHGVANPWEHRYLLKDGVYLPDIPSNWLLSDDPMVKLVIEKLTKLGTLEKAFEYDYLHSAIDQKRVVTWSDTSDFMWWEETYRYLQDIGI